MAAALPPHAGQPLGRLGKPLAEARAVVIMVHGRGASPQSILELAYAIPHPDVAYLAPGARGGTWYPQSFMAPIAANEPGITSGISVVHALVDDVVAAGIPEERIVILGFSQGGCLATTSAQRRPRRYGGVVGFSAGLIGPPGTQWSREGSFEGTPVFLGCSDVDAHIPVSRVRETEAHLREMGAEVTCRIYQGMGHLVNEDEIAFARDLLKAVAG